MGCACAQTVPAEGPVPPWAGLRPDMGCACAQTVPAEGPVPPRAGLRPDMGCACAQTVRGNSCSTTRLKQETR